MQTIAPLPSSAGAAPPPAGARGRPDAPPLPDAPPPPGPQTLNPALRLDPALGLVVLELGALGGDRSTIPDARQLAAYRAVGRVTAPGAPPSPEPTATA